MAISAKNLNTRVALKYDSYVNWQTYNPILLKGELAIAHLPENSNSDASGNNPAIQNTPNLLIKVGDGINHYNDLKFVSALAADVYAWAKAATPPDASTIPNLDKFISDAIQDTDTQYQIVAIEEGYSYKLQSKTLDGTWTDVTGSTITLTDIDSRLDTLEAALQENGAVDTKINDAIGGLDYSGKATDQGKFVTNVTETDGVISVVASDLAVADIPELPQSKVTGLETALAGKQDNLEIDGTVSSTNKVATQETVSNAIAALDGVAAADASSATKIVAEVTQTDGVVTVQKVAVADILPDVADTENGFVVAVSQTDGAISVTHKSATEVLGFAGNYDKTSNPIATKDYVTEAVADLNGAMHFIGSVADDPTVTAPTLPEGKDAWEAGDVVIFGVEEFVFDGTNWLELGNESLYAIDSEVDAEFVKVRQEMAADKLALQGEIDSDIAAARTEITKEIGDAVAGLDYSGKAAGQGKFVTNVTETDGVIEVTAVDLVASDIPVIAQNQVDGLEAALEGKQDNLEIDGTVSSTNKVATQETVSTAIAGLDSSIAEESGKVISSFEIADGVIKADSVKKVELHSVATSGKVEDIEQDGLVIINCGTSNTNITASDAEALSIPNA